jgi:hypothetical protein
LLNELNFRKAENSAHRQAFCDKLRKTCRLRNMGAHFINLTTVWSLLLLATTSLYSQQPLRTEKQFERYACELPLQVNWYGGEFADQIIELAKLQRIGVWIDRDVDGTQSINLAVRDATFEQILWLAAEQAEIGVAKLEDAFYLGPKSRAARLQFLFDELLRQAKSDVKAPEIRRKLIAKIDPSSPMFAEPQVWIWNLMNERGLNIIGAEQISHDVWPSQELPPMPLIQAVGLWTVGFDLWPTVDNEGSIRIHPPEFPQRWTTTYPELKHNTSGIAELLAKYPGAECKPAKKGCDCSGDEEFFLALNRNLAFSRLPAKNSAEATKLYTISTQASRGTLLASIAQQLSLEFEYDPQTRSQLEEVIKLDAKGADLDGLLQQVTAGSSLKVQITEKKLTVTTNQ